MRFCMLIVKGLRGVCDGISKPQASILHRQTDRQTDFLAYKKEYFIYQRACLARPFCFCIKEDFDA